jgi:hypothetical protein
MSEVIFTLLGMPNLSRTNCATFSNVAASSATWVRARGGAATNEPTPTISERLAIPDQANRALEIKSYFSFPSFKKVTHAKHDTSFKK